MKEVIFVFLNLKPVRLRYDLGLSYGLGLDELFNAQFLGIQTNLHLMIFFLFKFSIGAS